MNNKKISEQLNILSKKVHQNAKHKGFWDKPRNYGELFMLIVSELGEAIEADRKGRHSSLPDFEKSDLNFGQAFEKHVKDTFQDEIADVAIRLLDYARSEQMEINIKGLLGSSKPITFIEFDDIGENLMVMTGLVHEVYEHHNERDKVLIGANPTDDDYDEDDLCFEKSILEESVTRLFIYLFGFSDQLGFDLMRHIDLKMQYNSTRERLHGKNY